MATNSKWRINDIKFEFEKPTLEEDMVLKKILRQFAMPFILYFSILFTGYVICYFYRNDILINVLAMFSLLIGLILGFQTTVLYLNGYRTRLGELDAFVKMKRPSIFERGLAIFVIILSFVCPLFISLIIFMSLHTI